MHLFVDFYSSPQHFTSLYLHEKPSDSHIYVPGYRSSIFLYPSGRKPTIIEKYTRKLGGPLQLSFKTKLLFEKKKESRPISDQMVCKASVGHWTPRKLPMVGEKQNLEDII
ncbi:hypothetical protein AVEN_7193-1 [Araneus ventricosus]|uniref:Uncharacterized protein n=1 Tax=Araneus ventricosus TaxID=182803 RepID=A0A4Y2R493_ARAVE|nr:hypothetical protein AVEN_7193-1 [Araneus ventricosus]